MEKPVLVVDELTVEFKNTDNNFIAVNRAGFSVFQGKITAIVGESGSGKTLTALSVINLLPKGAIVSGEVLFNTSVAGNTNLLKLTPSQFNQLRGNAISMIFQEPMTSLNPAFTCGSQVMEVIKAHQRLTSAAARKKTVEYFKKVHLPDAENMVDRYPHQLSGGQKQRVMIAMAMCCNPSVLIADEPTTALDVTVQKKILELTKELQQQTGMAVIFISHDLSLVADIADHIIVMQKGNIVEQGSTKEILFDPKQPYTKALLACQPAMFKKGKRLSVVEDLLSGSNIKQPNDQENIRNTQVEDILKVEHLKVYFPEKNSLFGKGTGLFKAVDDIGFTVKKGETIGLVGESGCGKTTVARAILQLIKTTSGNIFLEGQNLVSYNSKQLQSIRKDLQIVFQDPYGSLNPRLTVGDAILEPMFVHSILKNKAERKDKVIELLEKVDLKPEHFNRYPHQFSGGQRQRICIARALSLNPSFLIFDESVSALDVSVQAQVLNLINDLKNELGFSSIFISHNLAVVHYISDRIIVMHQGKIAEEGTADQIYFSPQNEYTKTLIDSIPGNKLTGKFSD